MKDRMYIVTLPDDRYNEYGGPYGWYGTLYRAEAFHSARSKVDWLRRQGLDSIADTVTVWEMPLTEEIVQRAVDSLKINPPEGEPWWGETTEEDIRRVVNEPLMPDKSNRAIRRLVLALSKDFDAFNLKDSGMRPYYTLHRAIEEDKLESILTWEPDDSDVHPVEHRSPEKIAADEEERHRRNAILYCFEYDDPEKAYEEASRKAWSKSKGTTKNNGKGEKSD